MRFGSLFAGIGGIDLGLERAGMRCAWQVEIDDYCTKVLEKHWPSVARFRDVRDCGAHNLEPVDLICGGFPCQPVSCAGKRKGTEDSRWLWPEFARVVSELQPRWVLIENVPGLLHLGMGDVLGDLSALGYDAEWDSIPAAAFGAPHLRCRVFFVAHSRRECRKEGAKDAGQSEKGTDCSSCADNAERSSSVADADPSRRGRTYFANAHNGRVLQAGGSARAVFGPSGSWLSSRTWHTEPEVGRVADGIPSRVDRLRCLGNAVVPQVAEWIGRRIMEAARPPDGG